MESGAQPRDHGEALAVLRRAIELGTNFIDTADAYGPYVSEAADQGGPASLPTGSGDRDQGRAGAPQRLSLGERWAPEHLREACEASLKRLGVEQITLYQFPPAGPHVPFEDSVGELGKLQREGKIRHIGLSNVDTQQLAAAACAGQGGIGTESLQRGGPRVG